MGFDEIGRLNKVIHVEAPSAVSVWHTEGAPPPPVTFLLLFLRASPVSRPREPMRDPYACRSLRSTGSGAGGAGMATERPLARRSDGLAAASQSIALELRKMSLASMAKDTKTDRRGLPRARGAERPRAGRALTAPGQARVRWSTPPQTVTTGTSLHVLES